MKPGSPNLKKAFLNRFPPRRRKNKVRYVTMLPSLITLINGICGFASMVLVSQGPEHFTTAGYLIFYGMIADMLDGRVARMSHSTSSFGGQLDSMCDMVTFGAAPAFMVFKLLTLYYKDMVGGGEIIIGEFMTRTIWLAAIAYVCCAAVRLARFNVENIEDESAHMSFFGLPSPAAAGALASLVLFHQDLANDPAADAAVVTAIRMGLLYALPIITLGTAVLMVTRVRYPHIVNQYLRGKKPVTHFIWAGFTVGLIYLCGLRLAMVICFDGYAFWGLSRWFYKKLMRKSQKFKPVTEPTTHP